MPLAAIVAKPQKPELGDILNELLLWLAAHDFTWLLDPHSARYLNREDEAVDRQEMPDQRPAIVITLGGDGTLLSAARAFAQTEVPLLGVNLGSLGFLTEVPLNEIYTTLEAWLAGKGWLPRQLRVPAGAEPTPGVEPEPEPDLGEAEATAFVMAAE